MAEYITMKINEFFLKYRLLRFVEVPHPATSIVQKNGIIIQQVGFYNSRKDRVFAIIGNYVVNYCSRCVSNSRKGNNRKKIITSKHVT